MDEINTPSSFVLAIFLISYLFFLILPNHKGLTAWGGVLILFITGETTFSQAFSAIEWNVLGLFLGTLLLAELFTLSRMPAVIAERLVDSMPSIRSALVAVLALTSIISAGVENVAVVLILAPIIIELCRKMEVSPVYPLVLMGAFSNLQGAATLIGDPPSMLLASALKMDFLDFFWFQGKPSIFFAIQAGFIIGLLYTFWIFRKEKHSVKLLRVEKITAYYPSFFLVFLIIGLSLGSFIDPGMGWFVGTFTIFLSVLGLAYNHFKKKLTPSFNLVKELDWNTFFFLSALFILVRNLESAGWIHLVSKKIVTISNNGPLFFFLFLTLFSLFFSAFVDNVPYLLVMLPLVKDIASATGISVYFLGFALLIAASLGGNITPIGATANITVWGLLKKIGHPVSFFHFAKIGLPFTIITLVPALLFLWWVWL